MALNVVKIMYTSLVLLDAGTLNAKHEYVVVPTVQDRVHEPSSKLLEIESGLRYPRHQIGDFV